MCYIPFLVFPRALFALPQVYLPPISHASLSDGRVRSDSNFRTARTPFLTLPVCELVRRPEIILTLQKHGVEEDPSLGLLDLGL